MSIPLAHETTRRQLPRGPSCQCRALLSYKPRPKPVFRPDAPVESVEELCDEVFRIGTSILIRLAVPVPPAQMAYFECLNELDTPQCANPECKPHEYDSSTPCPEHGPSLVAGELREDSQPPDPSIGREGPSADPNAQGFLPTPHSDVPLRESLPELLYPKVDSDAAGPLIDQVPPVSGPRPETVSEAQDNAQHRPRSNPIVRYVTKEQLKVMGWKDLFKLARARGVFHGPMMKSRQELVENFLRKFGSQVPIYQNDKLPDNFPSKHASVRRFCDHVGSGRRQGPMMRRGREVSSDF